MTERSPLQTFIEIRAHLLTTVLVSTPAFASPYSDINEAAAVSPVTVRTPRNNISVLQGSGGNIGVLAGPDGILMVDAGIAVSQQNIAESLDNIDPCKLRYVINTH